MVFLVMNPSLSHLVFVMVKMEMTALMESLLE